MTAASLLAGAGVNVAIVAPSGYPMDAGAATRAIERLRSYGCTVQCLFDPAAISTRFAASDAERAAQLHRAAESPEIDIVLALRGGYGLSRLLPMLDLELLSRSGKLFVGHSDFTALQMALLAKAGGVSFAGPMACDDFSREDPSDFTLEQFWQCVRNPAHAVALRGNGHPPVDVEGILWGGNLTMLAHLVGTPYLPRIDGGILFLEDVNEHPYRIERMLLQLHYAGALNQKAVVLGDFSKYRLLENDNGYDFEVMLDHLRDTLDIPFFTGLPFGHTRDKTTLPVGAQCRLHSDGRTCVLTTTDYPTLLRD